MGCYLPKATFYIYFGLLLAGYLWLVGVLLGKYLYPENDKPLIVRWSNGLTDEPKIAGSILKPNQTEDYETISQDGINLDSVRDSPLTESDIIKLRYDWSKPMPSEIKTKVDRWCIQTDTFDATPSFFVCLFDPEKDTRGSGHLANTKTWEHETTKLLTKLLQGDRTAVLVDIGAYIGYYSLLAAKLGRPALAVEPFADSVHHIHEAMNRNNFEPATRKFVIVQSAINGHIDRRRNASFIAPVNDFGGRFLAPTDGEARLRYLGSRVLRAPVIWLDDLIPFLGMMAVEPGSGNRIILKIDTQGGECSALRHAQTLFAKFIVSAVVVAWPRTDVGKSASGGCIAEMFEFLHAQALRCVDVRGKPLLEDLLTKHEGLDIENQLLNDIVCVKKGVYGGI